MDNTKDKLIASSMMLMAQKGYHNTGLAEILAHAGVPKGSFYHYFASKEALGLAIIDFYAEQMLRHLLDHLENSSGSALMRLHDYFSSLLVYFEQSFGQCNCMLGNMAQEMASQSPTFRAAIATHYITVEAKFTALFEQAKQEYELSTTADSAMLARLLLSGWEGLIIRAKLAQHTSPLHEFIQFFFSSLPKP